MWWSHYADDGELFIIVVRINGEVQGIAPLYQSLTRAIHLRDVSTLRFIGSGGDTSPDDLGVLLDEKHEDVVIDRVCDAVFSALPVQRLQLADVPADCSLAIALLQKSEAHGWCKPLCRQQIRMVDDLPESIEAFEKNLSKNARKQRKRRRNHLEQAGDVLFKTCETQKEITAAFEHLTELHSSRHLSKGGTGSFHSERYRKFHLALMMATLQTNELRLLTLTLNGAVIGVEYAFISNGVLAFFQTGFNPDHSDLSPGHLLMMQSIDEAINDGAVKIDLLKGDYEYKRTYAKQKQTSIDMEIWRSPVFYNLSRLIKYIKFQRRRIGKA